METTLSLLVKNVFGPVKTINQFSQVKNYRILRILIKNDLQKNDIFTKFPIYLRVLLRRHKTDHIIVNLFNLNESYMQCCDV